MSETPIRPAASPITPIKPIGPATPIGPLTPIHIPVNPPLLNPTLRLVDVSGRTPPGSAVVFMTFTSPDGTDRLARLPMPANGILSPAASSPAEFLSRVRVFVPPADLVLDQAYPPGHAFTGVTTLTVRENPPMLALRLGTTVPFHLLHRTPLTLLQNPMGSLPQIFGLRTGGEPGAPSLPVEVHRILVPPGLQVSSVDAVPDPSPARVSAPAPQIQPPMVIDSPRVRTNSLRHWLPAAPPASGTFPLSPVVLQRVEQHPWGSIATVTLSPVQYDATARQYVHQPNLGYQLRTTPATTSDHAAAGNYLFPEINNADRSMTLLSALKVGNVSVIGAGPQVWLLDPAWLLSSAPCGMVIITDDTAWTGSSPNPPWLGAATPLPGAALPMTVERTCLIAEFERLAYWKSSRGMRTKVVPVSTIVAMHKAGDLKKFQSVPPLDLPEIIRSFIQYAQKTWQTDYVLLGGSKDIVPMRKVLAPLGADNWRASTGGGSTVTVSAPTATTRIAKITGPNGNTDASDAAVRVASSMRLMCQNSNIVILFSADGKGDRGWYFTTADDFANKNSGFTILGAQEDPAGKLPLSVIVFGGTEVDDDYRWIFPEAASETDFYYSDTARSTTGWHDWDATGNLLLGETQSGYKELDGVNTTGSVNVGRAPVTTGDEARNFVNKVLAYEQIDAVDAGTVDRFALGHVTLVSDNWQHPWVFSQFPATPTAQQPEPGPEQFMWSGSDAICRLDNTDGLVDHMSKTMLTAVPDFSLQALFEAATNIVDIPYDPHGLAATCWYFCDAGYTRLGLVPGASGSGFVRIRNAPAAASRFFWQFNALDNATVQKERVRGLWQNLYPGFGDIHRIYRDFERFPGQPIQPLLQNSVNDMMSQGSHFLSISGHGNTYYVSDFTTGDDANCGNAGRPYITYAHSCLTADPAGDGNGGPSLGAKLVTQENGALAYVGYARSCWTSDQVADYEMGFWCALQAFRRLGPPIAQRVNINGFVNYAHIFLMTLYGDPEMPVWTKVPTPMQVSFVYSIAGEGMLKGLESVGVTVMDNGNPVAGMDVNVLQGWRGSLVDPVWHFHTTTDDNGTASVWVRSPRKESMRVVVSSPVKGGAQPLYIPAVKDYSPTQKS